VPKAGTPGSTKGSAEVWPAGLPRVTGIAEPVRVDALDNGTRLGLGRQEMERQYIAAEFIERRQLEVEIQADEDEERKRKREVATAPITSRICCHHDQQMRACAALATAPLRQLSRPPAAAAYRGVREAAQLTSAPGLPKISVSG
jgi:hypothetical protein